MASHKLTPILMTGSLLLGLLLAIGHHFYYEYLNGKIIKTQSQQEWYLRVGTGLAFLTRALLSAAVGFAYTQILWRTLRSKPVTIEGVNSLFGLLHNAWDFTTLELWTAAPALAAVAMIAWALPLIAVVTPATLSVRVSPHSNITTIDAPIPLPDYDNLVNWAQMTMAGGISYYAPSNYISRNLLSVSSLGSILPIPAPFPNSSYSVNFYGPRIECGKLRNASFADFVSETIRNGSCCGTALSYVGFVPTNSCNSLDTAIDCASAGLQSAINESLISRMRTFDSTPWKTSTAKLYVAVPNPGGSSYMKPIECQLYNSSYAVNFTFHNSQQHITYRSKRLNGVSAHDAFSQQRNLTSQFKAASAYISIMDALGRLLLGSLMTSHYGGMSPLQTQIMSSVLMDTKEMQYVADSNQAPLTKDSPKTPTSVIGNISMSDALEQLVANTTISLFSSSNFLQNDTAASHGAITYMTTQIAFSYEPRNLFIAYGLGILVSATIVIIGLLCIKSASASYASSFSTILRTTRNPELDSIIPAAETSGAEPLSKQLGDIRLVLRSQGHRLDGIGEGRPTLFAVDPGSDGIKEMQKESLNNSFLSRDRERPGWI